MKNKKYGIFNSGLKKRTPASKDYENQYKTINLSSIEDDDIKLEMSEEIKEEKIISNSKKRMPKTHHSNSNFLRNIVEFFLSKKSSKENFYSNHAKNNYSRNHGENTENLKARYFLVPMCFLIIIGGVYIYKLSSAPTLKNSDITNQKNTSAEMVYEFGPLHPYEMCSMRKPDLIAHLGEPMGEGDGTDEESRFLRYEYEWFSLPTKSKIYYAREQRIYKAVITFKNIEFDELQKKITDGIGEPVSIEESKEFKDVIWMKDSIKYWLTKTEEDELNLEVRLAYYGNPEDLDLGYRPTIVQRDKSVDVTGDNEPDDVVLIGSKRPYTQISYDHLYLLILSGEKTYKMDFPKDMDGGQYPQMNITSDKEGKKIIVESGNNFILNQNIFTFENDKIKNISSTNEPIKK